jgi:hypothetical protein
MHEDCSCHAAAANTTHSKNMSVAIIWLQMSAAVTVVACQDTVLLASHHLMQRMMKLVAPMTSVFRNCNN